MRALWLAVLVLGACDRGGGPILVDDTGDSGDSGDDTADTSDTSDTGDTGPVGTDDDHDGWTVEDGDCDDSSVWVNPAWDERPNDDLDNDCDGRTDEQFAGVLALQIHAEGAESSAIHTIDILGDIDATWSTPGLYAYWMDERLDRKGWIAVDPGAKALWWISTTGAATLVWTFEGDPLYDDVNGPNSLWGVAAAPDGSALIGVGGGLIKVTWDDATVATTPGTATLVAEWDALEDDGSHDLWSACLAVNPITGAVGLFGYFGGFATWDETSGLAVVIVDDVETPTGSFLDAHADDKGGFYVLGSQLDPTNSTVESGIFRYNATQQKLVLKGNWINSDLTTPIDFTPVSFGIDSEAHEFYVTANGGWYRTVWRVFEGQDSYATQLYTNVLANPPDPTEAHRKLLAAAILWSED